MTRLLETCRGEGDSTWADRPRSRSGGATIIRPGLGHVTGHARNYAIKGDEMAGIGINRNAGLLLLAIWLILTGLSGLAALPIPAVLMTVLALLAGILILVGR